MKKKLDIRYIAGLIDADGCFNIGLNESNGAASALVVVWAINLIQLEQYRSVIENVQYTLQAGKIYWRSKGLSDDGTGMLVWQTTNYADHLKVAKRLLPHLHIKKNICKRFLSVLEEWTNEKYNLTSGKRRRSELARPKWLVEKVLDVSLTLNEHQQTRTARKNKTKKIERLKKRLEQFYAA